MSANHFDFFDNEDAATIAVKFNDCFREYDIDKDGFLDAKEFHGFLTRIFPDISIEKSKEFLKVFDKDKDAKINRNEFEYCWFHWLKQVLYPKSALIIVDVQNDFIDGTLAISEGIDVVDTINNILDTSKFDIVVYSLDWHPDDHISFFENVDKRPLHKSSAITISAEAKNLDTVVFDGRILTEQQLWPAHCIQKSWGSELHPKLKVVENSINIYKGVNPDIDSYSAFWDNKKLSQTNLVEELTRRNITDTYVCGLAFDVCVSSTALHSIEHGFRTIVIEDASRGLEEKNILLMKERLLRNGAIISNSNEIPHMVSGKTRSIELAFKDATNVMSTNNLVERQKHSQTRK